MTIDYAALAVGIANDAAARVRICTLLREALHLVDLAAQDVAALRGADLAAIHAKLRTALDALEAS